jgi:hypothetical protein
MRRTFWPAGTSITALRLRETEVGASAGTSWASGTWAIALSGRMSRGRRRADNTARVMVPQIDGSRREWRM